MGTSTSPEWYPLEALTIVEHRIVRKLSPAATEKMLEEASKRQYDNLRNIVNRGLAVLGVSSLSATSRLRSLAMRLPSSMLSTAPGCHPSSDSSTIIQTDGTCTGGASTTPPVCLKVIL
jgi:hypothetical protein